MKDASAPSNGVVSTPGGNRRHLVTVAGKSDGFFTGSRTMCVAVCETPATGIPELRVDSGAVLKSTQPRTAAVQISSEEPFFVEDELPCWAAMTRSGIVS